MNKIDPRRLERVEALYLSGTPVREIQRRVSEEFGCTRRMVRNYLALVRTKIAELAKGETPEDIRARVDGMLLRAFKLAGDTADPKAMVAAAHRYGELHGVFAPKKLEVSASLDLEGLHASIAKLAAGADAGRDGDVQASGAADSAAAGATPVEPAGSTPGTPPKS